jgi:hypothetical protein
MIRPPTTDGVPPALLARLEYVFSYFDPVEPGPPFLPDYESLVREGRPWWSAGPALEALGHELLAASHHPEMRRRACMWLGMFPSLEMVAALRAIALSPDEPRPLRDQAAWTLGFRQLQDRHDALHWRPDVVAAADAALLEVARLPTARDELRELPVALRHVASPAILALFAEDPVRWAPSLECFADPPLARAVLARLPELPAEDLPRAVRLVADTLGDEACEPLLAFCAEGAGAGFADRVASLLAALAVDAMRAKPALEAMLASMSDPSSLAARARWHEANQGVLPTVRALRTARTSAAMPPEERTDACRLASDLIASQARIAILAEEYLYAMWRHVALRARDPQRVAALVDAHPPALAEAGVLPPYLEALADAGRFRKLLVTSKQQAHRDGGALAAWLLATRGRPFLALSVRAADRGAAPSGVAAQALALFLAGRPDLARRTLADERPRAERLASSQNETSFPGPDERWRAVHEGEAAAPLRALLAGLDGLLECAKGAPEAGDPDVFDVGLLASFEKSLERDLSGATVFLAGEHVEQDALERFLVERGARVAPGPFAGVDFYVLGSAAPLALVAKLERQGARRIDDPRARSGAHAAAEVGS